MMVELLLMTVVVMGIILIYQVRVIRNMNVQIVTYEQMLEELADMHISACETVYQHHIRDMQNQIRTVIPHN